MSVPPPNIVTDLSTMDWPERCAEVVVFTLKSIEHWLSPGGLLREIFRLSLWLTVVLTACSVLVVPSVTAVLHGASEWSELTATTIENITRSFLAMPPIVVSLVTLFLVVKLFQRYRHRRGRSGYAEDRYDGYQ